VSTAVKHSQSQKCTMGYRGCQRVRNAVRSKRITLLNKGYDMIIGEIQTVVKIADSDFVEELLKDFTGLLKEVVEPKSSVSALVLAQELVKKYVKE